MKDKKDAFLIIRVPNALKDRLQSMAARRKVRLSALVRDILAKTNG